MPICIQKIEYNYIIIIGYNAAGIGISSWRRDCYSLNAMAIMAIIMALINGHSILNRSSDSSSGVLLWEDRCSILPIN